MKPRSLFSFAGLVAILTAAGCGGSVDTRPPKWSYISPLIMEPNCGTATCHSVLTQRNGFRFDSMTEGYKSAKRISGGLVLLLRGELSPYRRMPPDVPLSNDDILLIDAWVGLGMPWDGPGQPP